MRSLPATVATIACLAGSAIWATASAQAARTIAAGGPAAAAGTITTVAGGPGGPALGSSVAIGAPCAATFSGGGLYVADQVAGSDTYPGEVVRRISMHSGRMVNLAGSDSFGFTADGKRAASGPLGSVCGVAVDHAGNLLLSDGDLFDTYEGSFSSTGNNRVRVVAARTGRYYGQAMTAGHIYTIAGTGAFAYSGDGGPAAKAALDGPAGLAVDGAGNIVVADTGNNRIRVIAERSGSFYGVRMTAGNIYTIAGGGSATGDGALATQAWLALDPDSSGGQVTPVAGVRIDHSGNVVLTDTFFREIRVVAASTGTFYGQAMTVGHIYTIAGGGTSAGNGGPAAKAALSPVHGLAIDHAGNVVIADEGPRLRIVAVRSGTFYGQHMTAGDIYTLRVPGSSTPSVDGAGSLISCVDGSPGLVWVTAARSGTFYGRRMTAGHSYRVLGARSAFSGEAGPATSAVITPAAVASDGQRNLLITDPDNFRLLVVASRSRRSYGRLMTVRHIYTIGGDGKAPGARPASGVAATRTSLYATGVAVDQHGNLAVAQPVFHAGHNYPGGLRIIAASTGRFYGRRMKAGDIYTVAGGGSVTGGSARATRASVDPASVAVDRWGNLVMATSTDTSYFLTQVRVLAVRTGVFYGLTMQAGDIYTIAGTRRGGSLADAIPARLAAIEPLAVAIDAAGNVLLADGNTGRIRIVARTTGTFYGQRMSAGDIYSIAGGGTAAGSGELALQAFLMPNSITVDRFGNVLVTQAGFAVAHTDPRVYVVAARTGTFYGQPMTASHIYVIAGRGGPGDSGDGGPATLAQLASPNGIAIWPGRGVVIADSRKVRMISGG